MKNCVTKVEHQNTKNQTVINIYKLPKLTFDMLCCLLEYMMTLWAMHWQSASPLEKPVVQNGVNETTKYCKNKSKTCVVISMTYMRT